MKTFYTLKNIHDLLAQKYPKIIQWNYDIYDPITGKTKKATIEDFKNNPYDTIPLIFVYDNDIQFSLDVRVSNFNFVVFDQEPNIMGSGSTTVLKDDFTRDWIQLLLNEHKSDYAEALTTYTQQNIKRIEDYANNKITEFANKVNADAKRYSSEYEELERLAQPFLTESEPNKSEN